MVLPLVCCDCRSAFRCCVVVYLSRLPLFDRVPVIAAAAVVFQLRLEGGRHGNTLDSRRVDIVDADNGLLPVRVPLLCCCLCVTIAIAIAIVGSGSSCSCCCDPIAIAIVGSRWCSGCTWREGRHGDKDADRERVNIVVDDTGLLLVRVSLLCCLGVMISIVIVGSRSSCCCCGVPVALGGRTS